MMSHLWQRISASTVGVVLSILLPASVQAASHLEVSSCDATMVATHESGIVRLTFDKPKPDAAFGSSCTLENADVNLAQDPVFDFHIRVKGNHPIAFDLMFGKAGIGYGSGLPYSYPESHVLNIVGNQTGVYSIGDLGEINDGAWHHVVVDLAFAVKNWLDLDPEKIGPASLAIIDGNGSQQFFAASPPEPTSGTVELRDMVLRPRAPNERADNDLDFSVRSSSMGDSANAGGEYLVGGSVVSRNALEGAQVVVEGEHLPAFNQVLGDFQGRKDFALKVAVPAGVSELRAKIVAKGDKVLAQRQLPLPPELNYLQNATINIIPNSHEDLAWLDTQQATGEWRRDRAVRPAIDLLEQNPDYHWGLETNILLIDYLANRPEKAQLIHTLIAEKRLSFGAMYNQPYQDMWGSESVMRELYYGRKWLRDHLGSDVDCKTAWGTDVPVVLMQMPQILAKSGVKYLMLGRFRPGLFDWYSPDGSKVSVGSLGIYGQLSSFYTPYTTLNLALQIPQLLHNWEPLYKTHDIPPQFPISDMSDYLPPTTELLPLVHEWNSDAKQKYGAGFKIRFNTAEGFMDSITQNPATKLPVLKGEWVDTWGYIVPTQHTMAAAGREAEWDLTSAEEFWTLKYLSSGKSEPYQREAFDEAWMAHIYFDHGPGGFNGDVTDTYFLAQEEKALLMGRSLLGNAVNWIAARTTSLDPNSLKLVVFNPLSWKRGGPTQVEIPMSPDQDAEITAADGTVVPSQRVPQVPGGTVRYVVAASNIPSVGYATFKVALKGRKTEAAPHEEFSNKSFENPFYRLEFVPGGLKSIYDKQLNKELLRTDEFLGGEIFAMNSVGCDSSGYTGFGEIAQPSWKSIEKASQYSPLWRVTESGPVRTGWRMEQPFKDATVRLDLYAYQQTKRLEFNISILHWSGQPYKEFRMAMPVDIQNGQVAYEVPYGVLEVGKDELQEAPFKGMYSIPSTQIHPRFVQNWISATNGDFGVILSSQATTWDYLDGQEKKDRFTLLQPILLASRRSCHPQGNSYSPAGDHEYHFGFSSFKGTWHEHFQFGDEVNAPFPGVVVQPKTSIPPAMLAILPSIEVATQIRGPFLPSSLSLCEVSSPHYVVSDIKLADDKQGIIVRGYEIADQGTPVSLKFPLNIEKANATDLIEDDLPERVNSSGGSVQFVAGHRAINAMRISGGWAP